MTTTRLTNNIRTALLGRLMDHAFGDRARDIVSRAAAFAVRLHEDAMGDDWARMQRLPEGWLPTISSIKVMIAGEVRSPTTDGALVGHSLPENLRRAGAKRRHEEAPKMRVPSAKQNNVLKVYAHDHPLALEYLELEAEQASLDIEIGRAYRSAKAAVESVGTVQKLIEVWPEAEAFASDFLHNGERKAVLPAIPRADLNAALGLPPT